ncbi:MAG: hypothetical protein WDZ59_08810 [Pirellulales bacterium]
MHQFVTSAMTLLLAAHVTLGCCWHHGHTACASVGGESGHSGGEAGASHACSSTSLVTDHQQHHDYTPWSHPCEDGRCAFTGAVRDTADDAPADEAIAFAWDGATHTTLGPAATAPRPDAALPTIFPPARRHLLLEVLLI